VPDCPDHVDRVDLCPDCGGLRTQTMTRVPGAYRLTVEPDGPGLRISGLAAVYVGPIPEPCAAAPVEADRG
jgi:hypothetical protein